MYIQKVIANVFFVYCLKALTIFDFASIFQQQQHICSNCGWNRIDFILQICRRLKLTTNWHDFVAKFFNTNRTSKRRNRSSTNWRTITNRRRSCHHHSATTSWRIWLKSPLVTDKTAARRPRVHGRWWLCAARDELSCCCCCCCCENDCVARAVPRLSDNTIIEKHWQHPSCTFPVCLLSSTHWLVLGRPLQYEHPMIMMHSPRSVVYI